MKQSAAKTLGVAALGAAFAAVGAGAANAAPAVPDAGQPLGAVAREIPTDSVAKQLPGTGETLNQAKPALRSGLATARDVQRGRSGPRAGLLGGMPIKGMQVGSLPLS
ncbi:ATP-binding protein [Streptomyces sp. NPDC015220]|uniref:ATP-binding protein n=1 Tax=Streptomyces sp. NPDC015220 TaxID=3364947 RepID=UPI0036FD1FA4